MPITLALDAATYAGSVAVLRDGHCVAEAQVAMRGEREERLMPAVVATLENAGVHVRAVERVVCGAGPGSFTSLRIAAAIAKGVALAANAPLYAVSSLALIVAGARPPLAPGRYVAVMDAMRGDVFASTIAVGDGALRADEPWAIVARGELEAHAAKRHARIVGPGEALDARPHARGAELLARGLARHDAVDVSSWEPHYGRLAEAQVKWEAAHGRPLTGGGA